MTDEPPLTRDELGPLESYKEHYIEVAEETIKILKPKKLTIWKRIKERIWSK